MPLLVISVLFGLSLLAAWVLFAKLKSSATVTNPKYQLGGAVAGFAVVMALLSGTYIKVDDKNKEDKIKKLEKDYQDASAEAQAGKLCREESTKEITYAGTIQPYVDDAYVVLGVSEAIVHKEGPNGTFSLKVLHVPPSEEPSLYVVEEKNVPAHKLVTATDNTAKLTIPH